MSRQPGSATKRRAELGAALLALLAVAAPSLVDVASASASASADDTPKIQVEPVGPTPIEPAAPDKSPSLSEDEPSLPDAGAQTSDGAPRPATQPPQTADQDREDQIDDVLNHPTRSIEEYEKVRADELHRRTLPNYAFTLVATPKVFSSADLRKPANTGFDQTNPTLYGLSLGYDHTIFKYTGVLSAGLDIGFYGSAVSNPYGGLLPGFLEAFPHATYEANFLKKQWVVPIVRLGPEFVRAHYSFENQSITAVRIMPRADLGVMIYLNIFEPSAAAEMQSNWEVKRTYVGGFFTIMSDSSGSNLNLNDRSLRVVLRFEE